MNPPFTSARRLGIRGKNSRGFTLLEMMITLLVFIFLCASVFGILSGVLQTASSLQDNQNRHDQIERFNAFLKKKLKSLPAQGTVISYRRGQGEGLDQDGIIFGRDQQLTAIDAKIQPNGYYQIRLAYFDSTTLPPNVANSPVPFFETQVIDDKVISWTPLIQDIVHIDMKFQQYNLTDWVTLWSDDANAPNLLELSIQQAAVLQPTVMDFWIPKINTPSSGAPNGLPGGFGPGGPNRPPGAPLRPPGAGPQPIVTPGFPH